MAEHFATIWPVAKPILESATFFSVLSYLAQKYIVEPRQELQAMLAKIDADLIFYSHLWANPGEARTAETEEARIAYRRHSADIRAKVRALGLRKHFFLVRLPSPADLKEAATCLIRLSNSIVALPGEEKGEAAKRNRDDEAAIRKLLNIPE